MKNHFKYWVILFLFSCDQGSLIELEDVWEGERLYVESILTIGDPLKVFIKHTVNPILNEKPEDLIVRDAKVLLVINEKDTLTLIFDSEEENYYSEDAMLAGNCYELNIMHNSVMSRSETVCVPEILIDIDEIKMDLEDLDFTFEGALSFENIESYSLRVFPTFSDDLWMKYAVQNSLVTDNTCFNENTNLDLDCVTNKSLVFSYNNSFADFFRPYDFSNSDFKIIVSFDSKRLTELKDGNSYRDGEFEVNQSFVSSFDNCYGFFDYRYRRVFNYPLK